MNVTKTKRLGPHVPDGAEPLEKRQLYLDEMTINITTRIGSGNSSLGVREAARRVMELDGGQHFNRPCVKKFVSGVQPDDGATNLVRVHRRIDPDSEAILRKIGKGQISLGIREAVRRLLEADDVGVFNLDRHLRRDS